MKVRFSNPAPALHLLLVVAFVREERADICEFCSDSIAGQMHALKSGTLGAAPKKKKKIVKKEVEESSDDDESDTEGEADDTSETDTDTDTDGE